MTPTFGQLRGSMSADVSGNPMEAIEFELRLDLAEVSDQNFEDGVRTAAEASGGSFLFEMPAALPLGFEDRESYSRVAVIRFPSMTGELLVFAALLGDDGRIHVLRHADVGERFYGVAKAYLGILKRLQPKDTNLGHA